MLGLFGMFIIAGKLIGEKLDDLEFEAREKKYNEVLKELGTGNAIWDLKRYFEKHNEEIIDSLDEDLTYVFGKEKKDKFKERGYFYAGSPISDLIFMIWGAKQGYAVKHKICLSSLGDFCDNHLQEEDVLVRQWVRVDKCRLRIALLVEKYLKEKYEGKYDVNIYVYSDYNYIRPKKKDYSREYVYACLGFYADCFNLRKDKSIHTLTD